MRVFLFFIYSVLSVVFFDVKAQVSLTGKVSDEHGLPVPNVMISIKGNPRLQSTSLSDGTFTINLSDGKYIISFNHIMYEYKEQTVGVGSSKKESTENSNLSIILKEKSFLLNEVTVLAKNSLSLSSLSETSQRHKQIAGGVSLIETQPELRRLETLKDIIGMQPGVIIQESFGSNDLPRLNIRGSGIQSNPQRRGVCLSQDGIPLNFADGSYIIGALDPYSAQYVEVLKGANALRFGAATLGGAINFSSYSGINTPGGYAKIEVGSHNHYTEAVRYGTNKGKWDFSTSLSTGKQDGFRQHNQSKRFNLQGNIGYRFNQNIETRLLGSYSYNNFEIPGPLTLQALYEDPTQVNPGVVLPYTMGPNVLRDKPGREISLARLANRTVVRFTENSRLFFSLSYQYADDRFVFPITISTQHSLHHDWGLKTEWEYKADKHIFTSGLVASYGYIDRRGHINKDGQDSFMFSWNHLYASNLSFYAEDNWQLSDRFSLITNLQIVYNERNSKDVFPFPELRPWYSHSSHKYRYFYSENISKDQSFSAINPRVGFIYNSGKNKDIQFFINASQSYEPPTFDELVGTEVTDNINTSPKKLFVVELDKQTATTIEIGSRHKGKRFAWDLSLYHSWVKDELLEVKDFVQGIKNTRNYPNTEHSGIELGVSYIPFSGIFSANNKDQISLKGVYNYSDFRFTSGEYEGNRLAGIPRQFITGEIEYRYHEFFSLSVNTEWQPESTPVDHTNTLNQPSYSIFGFRIGIDKIKNWTLYLEGKNIFNKYYASSYVISDQIHQPAIPFPDFTARNMAFFMPGPTRALYIGLSYKFN